MPIWAVPVTASYATSHESQDSSTGRSGSSTKFEETSFFRLQGTTSPLSSSECRLKRHLLTVRWMKRVCGKVARVADDVSKPFWGMQITCSYCTEVQSILQGSTYEIPGTLFVLILTGDSCIATYIYHVFFPDSGKYTRVYNSYFKE